jgi:mono/diheme cytochrome c family protein
MSTKLIFLFSALIVFSCMTFAQDQTQIQGPKTIQHVSIKPTSAASGKGMFTSYCAVCHGTDGKGGGPAASALNTPPADLTLLSKSNNGKYPALKVSGVIRGTSDLPAHGSREMPVWGPLFSSMSNANPGEVQQRIANLTAYVESLQKK